MTDTPGGRIITFYSYKGGAGRSMLLANIAWVLASEGKRVLVIDWDLEAPGLQHYFRPFLLDPDLHSTDGLIDLLWDFITEALGAPTTDADLNYPNILRYADSLQWEFPNNGMLDFVAAGRQSASYPDKVNSLDWESFYNRIGGGGFFEAVKEQIRAEYDYILIDSRTGVSDTAGICTVQFADCLVVCFTMNRQSIDGAAAVARSVVSQRQQSTGVPMKIFPVPTRVERYELDMLERQKIYARRAFDSLETSHSKSLEYWSSVEIPHNPRYSYFEQLAAFVDDSTDPNSLLAATVRLTAFLTGGDVKEFNSYISNEDRHRIVRNFSGEAE